MRLLVMRHGEAVAGADDAARELTDHARERLSQLAPEVSAQLGRVTGILSSPLMRAQQTAELLAGGLPPTLSVTLSHFLLPTADVESVFGLLESYCSQESVVLVITHQPLMGQLISLLCEGSRVSGFSPAPAELAVIDLDWPASGLGCLRGWYRL